MTAGRKFLRASTRDAIIKDSYGWIWNGSRFCSDIARPVQDALRFKSLSQARSVAAHLRKVVPGSSPVAVRAKYREQAGFSEKYKSIEVPQNEKNR